MVALRERGASPSMAIDAGGVWAGAGRRGSITSYKFRVREERKKVIRISNAKYRTIEDHESGLRRFVLIRNTLRRLQREAREEKLARHRAGATNVSPSYLSASRPRSPSPPCDVEVCDVLSVYGQPAPTPISAIDEDDPLPPAKKPRLFLDDDKENERTEPRPMDDCDKDESSRIIVDDTQEILRDLYETYTGETGARPSTPTPPRPDSPCVATQVYSCPVPAATTITTNSNNNNNSNTNNNNNINSVCAASVCSTATSNSSSYSSSCSASYNSSGSGYHDWGRPQQQQYACGHASLLGNDLQSVVFHSLIASLES